MHPVEARDGGVYLRVRVQPKASRNALQRRDDGSIQVALTAPPVDGAANKALCAFIAKLCGCSKSSVTVVRGEKSREKTVQIEGRNVTEVTAILG